MNKTKSIRSIYIFAMTLCLFIALSIISYTFATFYVDRVNKESLITNNFGKISLDSNIATAVVGSVDLLANATIVEQPIQFSKSVNSNDMYVRAYIEFVINGTGSEGQVALTNQYLTYLNTNMITTYTDIEKGVEWVKNGNYYYLVTSANTNNLKLINNDYSTYTLLEEVVIPETFTQYQSEFTPLPIKFSIVFQSIQSNNEPVITIAQASDVFNDIF